jgi:hypothetical protein
MHNIGVMNVEQKQRTGWPCLCIIGIAEASETNACQTQPR